MCVELRWADPDGSTKPPVLQYRTYSPPFGDWSRWLDVPTVAVPVKPEGPANERFTLGKSEK